MRKIQERVHRSLDTIRRHIHDHNKDVKGRGYCIKCKRVKCALQSMEV